MKTRDERRQEAQSTVLALLEELLHQKVDWDKLPADLRAKFEPYLEEMSAKPEVRMRKTMDSLAASLGLKWRADSPSGHPYQARLDGQLFDGRERIAVVELEARNPKQIRGGLLDLLTYPKCRKLLVIGASVVVTDPVEVKRQIKEQVIPVLSQSFARSQEIGVFTERELKEAPGILSEFLGRSVA